MAFTTSSAPAGIAGSVNKRFAWSPIRKRNGVFYLRVVYQVGGGVAPAVRPNPSTILHRPQSAKFPQIRHLEVWDVPANSLT